MFGRLLTRLNLLTCPHVDVVVAGKGNSAKPQGLQEMVEAGAVGTSLHLDIHMHLRFVSSCIHPSVHPIQTNKQTNNPPAGLKLHEDWGTTPAAIDACLTLAEAMDVQVTIHTDTLNESGCVEHSVAAFKGRTIHTYHRWGGSVG